MSTTGYITEGAQLELAGAEHRLALATQAAKDFHAEHDGQVVSPELAQSLAHELDAIETELDAARRQVRHCVDVITSLSHGGLST